MTNTEASSGNATVVDGTAEFTHDLEAPTNSTATTSSIRIDILYDAFPH